MRTALLILGVASPALLFAQFQQPTGEELKMTADPKAPGAAAVYLNLEEISNDPIHFHSLYVRIKVLAEKGKELATVEIPYESRHFKVADIKGRTIHSDGTVIPLIGKPEDLLASKTGDRQFNRKVFTLPSVEVGSILEYRYQLDYDNNQVSSPQWEIQQPYFVHKAHYVFTPFKAFLPGAQNQTSQYIMDDKGRALNTLMWWPILPPGVQIRTDVAGRYSVDITDVPPIPDEEWMPPIRNLLYKVLFYYTYAHSAAEFWDTEEKHWSKDVNRFADPSSAIHQAVSGIVAPTDSDLDKAKKLYKAVQALDNTDFSREKGKAELKQLHLKAAKRAEDTWTQKAGSSEDIALLYLAMLRAAGLTAYAMKVVDREQGTFDPAFMSFDQLDDTLVILSTGGKEAILDPGEKMCPFGTLHWRHAGASGARQSGDNHNAGTTPFEPYTTNNLVRSGSLDVDQHGVITGEIRFIMNGQEALRWRQAALTNDLDEVKKQFDRWLESMVPDGVQAHIDHFLGLDDPDVNLLAAVKVQGTLGAATSKRLLLPGFFFQTRGSHPFVNQDKRLEAVDMHYGDHVTDEIVYRLPPGLAVEGAPQDTKIPWQDHAVFIAKSASAPGKITIARSLARAFTFAKPEEYQDLRAFYQKVAAADQQQLVLTTSSPAKGN
jgi:transglutaminase-like putative cysteine protease